MGVVVGVEEGEEDVAVHPPKRADKAVEEELLPPKRSHSDDGTVRQTDSQRRQWLNHWRESSRKDDHCCD